MASGSHALILLLAALVHGISSQTLFDMIFGNMNKQGPANMGRMNNNLAYMEPFAGGMGGFRGQRAHPRGRAAAPRPDPFARQAQITTAEEHMSEVLTESANTNPERQKMERVINQNKGKFSGDLAALNYIVEDFWMSTPGPIPPPNNPPPMQGPGVAPATGSIGKQIAPFPGQGPMPFPGIGPATGPGQYAVNGPAPGLGPYAGNGPAPGLGPYASNGPAPGLGPYAANGPAPGLGPYAANGPAPGLGPYAANGPAPGLGPYAGQGPAPGPGPYAGKAPVPYAGQGPAPGPVPYAGNGPAQYNGQGPPPFTRQAPAPYVGQAPAPYAGQAPAPGPVPYAGKPPAARQGQPPASAKGQNRGPPTQTRKSSRRGSRTGTGKPSRQQQIMKRLQALRQQMNKLRGQTINGKNPKLLGVQNQINGLVKLQKKKPAPKKVNPHLAAVITRAPVKAPITTLPPAYNIFGRANPAMPMKPKARFGGRMKPAPVTQAPMYISAAKALTIPQQAPPAGANAGANSATAKPPVLGDVRYMNGQSYVYTDADGFDTFQWLKQAPGQAAQAQEGQAAPAAEGQAAA